MQNCKELMQILCLNWGKHEWVTEWVKSLSRVRLFATPRTIAPQAPPSMGFSRQEYWSGLSFPSPGDLPDPGIEPRSPALQADALPSELKGLEAVKWTWPIKAILMVLHWNDINGREHKWQLFKIHFYVKYSLHTIQHFKWALCNGDQVSIISWGFIIHYYFSRGCTQWLLSQKHSLGKGWESNCANKRTSTMVLATSVISKTSNAVVKMVLRQ